MCLSSHTHSFSVNTSMFLNIFKQFQFRLLVQKINLQCCKLLQYNHTVKQASYRMFWNWVKNFQAKNWTYDLRHCTPMLRPLGNPGWSSQASFTCINIQVNNTNSHFWSVVAFWEFPKKYSATFWNLPDFVPVKWNIYTAVKLLKCNDSFLLILLSTPTHSRKEIFFGEGGGCWTWTADQMSNHRTVPKSNK